MSHARGGPARSCRRRCDEILRRTTRETPPAATHWSTRTLAQVSQVSFSTVGRIWRAHGFNPHRVKTFKLSNDPRFAETLEVVVKLYLHPAPDAIILAVDENSQLQP